MPDRSGRSKSKKKVKRSKRVVKKTTKKVAKKAADNRKNKVAILLRTNEKTRQAAHAAISIFFGKRRPRVTLQSWLESHLNGLAAKVKRKAPKKAAKKAAAKRKPAKKAAKRRPKAKVILRKRHSLVASSAPIPADSTPADQAARAEA